jgi:hypothetical protein
MEQQQRERIQSAVTEAVRAKSIESLVDTMYFGGREENPNDGLTEYDPRRILSIDGVCILDNAIASVGNRRESYISRGMSDSARNDTAMNNFTATSDEEAITGMRRLIQQRLEGYRTKWENISRMVAEGSQTKQPIPTHGEMRWRWLDALAQEYDWQQRLNGFDLGVRSLGLAIDSNGSVVPGGTKLTPDAIVEEMKKLPTKEEFRTNTQLPRILPSDR